MYTEDKIIKLKETIEVLLEQITAQAIRAEQLQKELKAREEYIEELNNKICTLEKQELKKDV